MNKFTEFCITDMDMADEYMPTSNMYEDSPSNETVTSPNGGYGANIKLVA